MPALRGLFRGVARYERSQPAHRLPALRRAERTTQDFPVRSRQQSGWQQPDDRQQRKGRWLRLVRRRSLRQLRTLNASRRFDSQKEGRLKGRPFA